MKLASLLCVFFVLVVMATGFSGPFAAENRSFKDVPAENIINKPDQSMILLAVMPEASKKKPKIQDPGGGTLQNCMDAGYKSYYIWLLNGKKGDLPLLAPISKGCDSCLSRNAEVGRGWGQASYNCVSQCCQ